MFPGLSRKASRIKTEPLLLVGAFLEVHHIPDGLHPGHRGRKRWLRRHAVARKRTRMEKKWERKSFWEVNRRWDALPGEAALREAEPWFIGSADACYRAVDLQGCAETPGVPQDPFRAAWGQDYFNSSTEMFSFSLEFRRSYKKCDITAAWMQEQRWESSCLLSQIVKKTAKI